MKLGHLVYDVSGTELLDTEQRIAAVPSDSAAQRSLV